MVWVKYDFTGWIYSTECGVVGEVQEFVFAFYYYSCFGNDFQVEEYLTAGTYCFQNILLFFISQRASPSLTAVGSHRLLRFAQIT